MVVEQITTADLATVPELQPPDWREITPSFAWYVSSAFCTPVKVMAGAKVAGVGAAILHGATGWIAHIIVRPEYRRQGIGGVIVAHLVRHLKSTGCGTVSLVATDLGYSVYQKAGFEKQATYVLLKRASLSGIGELPQGVFRLDVTAKDAVFALDRKVSGEDRRRILVDHLNGSYVYRSNGSVIGFYLPTLGEGLIVADTPKAGIPLMDVRLSRTEKATLPEKNLDGVRHLSERGFTVIRNATRMVFGPSFSWRPEKVYNRIAGNLG